MPSYRSLVVAACFVLMGVCVHAQQIVGPSQAPTVVFKFTWKQGMPWSDYVFTVNENGLTHFSGTGNSSENGENDSFQQDFTMSEANLKKAFEWAKGTDYFQGQYEARQKNIAKTGTKTLEFHGPEINTSTTYNFSTNPNIQQLTRLFQSIAVTIDYGRKLTYQYRFDKLGIDTRLKELTDLRANGSVEELQVIEPILRKIADDEGMMHMARLEARQLLKSATQEPPAPKAGNNQP